MPNQLFTEERYHILAPLRAHQNRVLSDQEEYKPMTRASEIMLNSEEPSIRTYYCARNVVLDYIQNHPKDPRGFKELGKVYLYSCVPENLDLAQEALDRAQSLYAQDDAEVWYLTSMCHQLRLFGWKNDSTAQLSESSMRSASVDCRKRKRLNRLAERALNLALQHSNGSNVYRFALSDFYMSVNRLSKALTTLQSGLSETQRTPADAAIFHQLGRFGISCLDGLRQRGRGEKAREVAAGALQYYQQAIEIHGEGAGEWKVELENVQVIVDQLMEQTYTSTGFAHEPVFNPSGPTSLRRWLNNSSSSAQESVYSSPTQTADSPPSSTNRSQNWIGDSLTEYLNTIEKQALTYEEGGADDVLESSWSYPSAGPQAVNNSLQRQSTSWKHPSSRTWPGLTNPSGQNQCTSAASTAASSSFTSSPSSHVSRMNSGLN